MSSKLVMWVRFPSPASITIPRPPQGSPTFFLPVISFCSPTYAKSRRPFTRCWGSDSGRRPKVRITEVFFGRRVEICVDRVGFSGNISHDVVAQWDAGGTNVMLMLTGEYEHTLDEKNRLFISGKLRGQIDVEEHGSNFYLVLGANGILCLYPEKYFQQIALAGAPGTGAPDEAVTYERLSFALANKVELDRQGRLLLPERLRKRARLGSNLTLVGVRDHIELWNTDDWDRYLEDHLDQFQNQILQARQSVLQKQSRDLDE